MLAPYHMLLNSIIHDLVRLQTNETDARIAPRRAERRSRESILFGPWTLELLLSVLALVSNCDCNIFEGAHCG